MLVWSHGQIVESSTIRVPLEDTIFEHGLGLFETLRTYRGRALFLADHLARMSNSARTLGLAPLEPSGVPRDRDVEELLRTLGLEEAIVRLTRTSGGEGIPPVLWMRANPLPPPTSTSYTVCACAWNVVPNDPLARHKSINYWHRRLAFAAATKGGFHESLLHDADGIVWEGSRTNLFAVVGDRLVTPPQLGPIVPGIMRQNVINLARGWTDVQEKVLSWRDLGAAREIFLTNSVRGILPVARVEGPTRWTVPGDTPITLELQRKLGELYR